MERIIIYKGDITTLNVDAIVNAANKSLLGGGGVDGAIHKAAGTGLISECRTLNGCETGDAKITSGYNLPTKFVIHTVGPVWQGGRYGEPELLRSCYLNSLKIASARSFESVAFPAISTGVYGYPLHYATPIAIGEVISFLSNNEFPKKIIFCVYDKIAEDIYHEILVEKLNNISSDRFVLY